MKSLIVNTAVHMSFAMFVCIGTFTATVLLQLAASGILQETLAWVSVGV